MVRAWWSGNRWTRRKSGITATDARMNGGREGAGALRLDAGAGGGHRTSFAPGRGQLRWVEGLSPATCFAAVMSEAAHGKLTREAAGAAPTPVPLAAQTIAPTGCCHRWIRVDAGTTVDRLLSQGGPSRLPAAGKLCIVQPCPRSHFGPLALNLARCPRDDPNSHPHRLRRRQHRSSPSPWPPGVNRVYATSAWRTIHPWSPTRA